MFLLLYVSIVCGSYYYAPGKSIDITTDITINEYLKNSFKLGIISFFNYSNGKNQAEYILKLAQFIIGNMIEWTYLGCFSALFITRMTSTENK